MSAWRSPTSAYRAGIVLMSKSHGSASSLSSQRSGAETGACGRGRTQ